MRAQHPLNRTWVLVGLILACAVAMAGCGSGGATAATPSRTVVVTMTDEMRYTPATYDFSVGDRVRFEVRNAGAVVHELYVGTAADQATHEQEMQAGHGTHDHSNSVSVDPGQTKTLDLVFARAGTLEIGCHEPGHWQAGMRGTITVS